MMRLEIGMFHLSVELLLLIALHVVDLTYRANLNHLLWSNMRAGIAMGQLLKLPLPFPLFQLMTLVFHQKCLVKKLLEVVIGAS